jgi:hypothetical protein
MVLRAGRALLGNVLWYSFLLEAERISTAIVRQEGLGKCKKKIKLHHDWNPLISSLKYRAYINYALQFFIDREIN